MKQNETILSIKSSLENKEKDLRNLDEKVEKLKESLETSVNKEVLKLSQLVIERTVKAVVAEFEQKQTDFEKK